MVVSLSPPLYLYNPQKTQNYHLEAVFYDYLTCFSLFRLFGTFFPTFRPPATSLPLLPPLPILNLLSAAPNAPLASEVILSL